MEHTPAWISRKYNNALKEQYQDHQQMVFSGMQSILLVLDGAFNKGKDFHNILPPTLEDALKVEKQQKIAQESYVSDMWWK